MFLIFKKTNNFVFCFILLLSISLLLGCNSETSQFDQSNDLHQKEHEEDISDEDTGMESTIENFNLEEFSDTGQKKWEIESTAAQIYEDIIKLTDVVGVAYGEEIDVTIKSDKGIYNKKTQDFQLIDNVRADTTNGFTLLTSKLNWDAKKERAYTDRKVLVKNEKVKILGSGAWAKPDLKEVKLKKDIVTNIDPDTIIVCDGSLEANYEENYAVFNENVIVKDARGKIWADEIKVYFNSEQEIQKVIAKGNVKIKRGKNITLSERAEYIAKENKVLLTGKPKLFVYPEEDKNKNLNSKVDKE